MNADIFYRGRTGKAAEDRNAWVRKNLGPTQREIDEEAAQTDARYAATRARLGRLAGYPGDTHSGHFEEGWLAARNGSDGMQGGRL